jgi:hypothetical protein
MSISPLVLAATVLGIAAAAGYLALAVVADVRGDYLPGWFTGVAGLPAAVALLLSVLAMRGTVAPPVPLVGVTLVSVALAPVARAAHRDDADGTTRAVTHPAD